jgi:hypothetical protein
LKSTDCGGHAQYSHIFNSIQISMTSSKLIVCNLIENQLKSTGVGAMLNMADCKVAAKIADELHWRMEAAIGESGFVVSKMPRLTGQSNGFRV